MKLGFVKSSPVFFTLITRSMWLLVAFLLVLAALVPAPLQTAADPAVTPNPVKSAWFLLWAQELVSYSRWTVYPVLAIGLFFLFLPWFPGQIREHHARWFSAGQRTVCAMTLCVCLILILLTVIALFFRGAYWSFGF